MTANAQQSYQALMEYEIYDRQPTDFEYRGMIAEHERLASKRRNRTKQEKELLLRYGRAISAFEKSPTNSPTKPWA